MVGCGDRQGLRQVQVRREVPSDPVTPAGRLDARGAAPGLALAGAGSAGKTDRFSGGAGRGPEGAPRGAGRNAPNVRSTREGWLRASTELFVAGFPSAPVSEAAASPRQQTLGRVAITHYTPWYYGHTMQELQISAHQRETSECSAN